MPSKNASREAGGTLNIDTQILTVKYINIKIKHKHKKNIQINKGAGQRTLEHGWKLDQTIEAYLVTSELY